MIATTSVMIDKSIESILITNFKVEIIVYLIKICIIDYYIVLSHNLSYYYTMIYFS